MRLAIFCDGDFWHGRSLEQRLARLKRGHNAGYWMEKIRTNVARDRRTNRALTEAGWTVLRFWESDIKRNVEAIVDRIVRVLDQLKAK